MRRFAIILLIGIASVFGGFYLSQPAGWKKPLQAHRHCSDICVELRPGGMMPDELAVKAGSFVQFNSADGKKHNLAEGDGSDSGHHNNHDHTGRFASGDFAADEAWRVQFKQRGTYKLHDHYNPNLRILIVVYE
jgi:plastocyanin